MKAYLVNAADPVLTASIEFGIRETDPARAASIIVEHMKADAKGVRLHKCEPLYLHCGNTFEAVMPETTAPWTQPGLGCSQRCLQTTQGGLRQGGLGCVQA